MDNQPSSEEALFHAALEFQPPEARAAYLQAACGGDVQLRQRVEALLRAAGDTSDLLEQPAARSLLSPAAAAGKRTADPGPGDAKSLAAITEKPGDRIGRYKLLERIGEGGCGVVYQAEQTEPIRRRVALKIVKIGMDTREVIARFEAERQALALMDHPNIAKVHDAGATGAGRPYFVMELVRGIPITAYCDESNLSTRERLDLFMQVCHAVQHAHQKGIIHRDLKPSNILVASHDGVPVPKVIDFGIAKATSQQPLTDKTVFTAFRQFIGTPAYMSPEQAQLSGLDIDTRSDIYSLGVLLYELLTGRPPFGQKELLESGLEEMCRIIRETEPLKPSTKLESQLTRNRQSAIGNRQSKEVRGDLDWIVMKCLEKDRTRRYETANALAQDLERHLKHEPVTAAAPGALYLAGKFIRRHRGGLGTAAALVLLLAAGVVVSTGQAVRARRAERAANQAGQAEAAQRQVAENSVAESRERLVRLDVANGIRAMDDGDAFGSLLWLTEALRQERTNAPSTNIHRLRLGTVLAYAPQLEQMWFHDGPVTHAAFSADGRRVVTASDDRTARVWDAATGQSLGAPLPHEQEVTLAVFSPNGRFVATACANRTARVWDLETDSLPLPPVRLEGQVVHLQFSADGQRLCAVASRGNWHDRDPAPAGTVSLGEVHVWNTASGREVRPSMRLNAPVEHVTMSADGEWIAVGCENGAASVWNLQTGHGVHFARDSAEGILVRPADATGEATARAWEPFLGGSRDYTWDAAVWSVDFSPDARRLVTGCVDGVARVWELETGRKLLTLKHAEVEYPSPYKGGTRAVFSPDGRRLLTVGANRVVKFWDAWDGRFLGQLLQNPADAAAAVYSPDGRWVATTSKLTGNPVKANTWGDFLALSEVRLWDAQSGEPVGNPLPQAGRIRALAFSPDGGGVLTASADQSARLWSLAGATATAPRLTHQMPKESLRTNLVAAPDPTFAFSLRDQETLERETRLTDAALSDDGRKVVTAGANGTARVWDAQSGAPLSPVLQMNANLKRVCFNGDDTRFITLGHRTTGAGEGAACIWEAASFRPVTPVFRFPSCQCTGDEIGAAFSADGRRLVIRSHAEVFLFDAETGQPESWPMKLEAPVITAAFSPDTNRVALYTGFRDPLTGTVSRGETRIWDLRTGLPVAPPLDAGQLGPLAVGRVNEQGRTNYSFLETAHIGSMDFSPDGRWLVTRGLNTNLTPAQMWSGGFTRVQLWDARTGQARSPALWPETFWCNTFFTSDSTHLYVLNSSKVVHLWDAVGAKPLAPPALNLRNQDLHWGSSDGQLLITRRGSRARLWDAVTGEPATPLLEDWSGRRANISWTIFRRNAWALLVKGEDWVEFWPVPLDRRPVEELSTHAQLLAARRFDANGAMTPLAPADLRQLWQRVRGGPATPMAETAERSGPWHERAVEACEREKQWFAAAFHLEQLLKIHPEDEMLRRRWARVRDVAALEVLDQTK